MLGQDRILRAERDVPRIVPCCPAEETVSCCCGTSQWGYSEHGGHNVPQSVLCYYGTSPIEETYCDNVLKTVSCCYGTSAVENHKQSNNVPRTDSCCYGTSTVEDTEQGNNVPQTVPYCHGATLLDKAEQGDNVSRTVPCCSGISSSEETEQGNNVSRTVPCCSGILSSEENEQGNNVSQTFSWCYGTSPLEVTELDSNVPETFPHYFQVPSEKDTEQEFQAPQAGSCSFGISQVEDTEQEQNCLQKISCCYDTSATEMKNVPARVSSKLKDASSENSLLRTANHCHDDTIVEAEMQYTNQRTPKQMQRSCLAWPKWVLCNQTTREDKKSTMTVVSGEKESEKGANFPIESLPVGTEARRKEKVQGKVGRKGLGDELVLCFGGPCVVYEEECAEEKTVKVPTGGNSVAWAKSSYSKGRKPAGVSIMQEQELQDENFVGQCRVETNDRVVTQDQEVMKWDRVTKDKDEPEHEDPVEADQNILTFERETAEKIAEKEKEQEEKRVKDFYQLSMNSSKEKNAENLAVDYVKEEPEGIRGNIDVEENDNIFFLENEDSIADDNYHDSEFKNKIECDRSDSMQNGSTYKFTEHLDEDTESSHTTDPLDSPEMTPNFDSSRKKDNFVKAQPIEYLDDLQASEYLARIPGNDHSESMGATKHPESISATETLDQMGATEHLDNKHTAIPNTDMKGIQALKSDLDQSATNETVISRTIETIKDANNQEEVSINESHVILDQGSQISEGGGKEREIVKSKNLTLFDTESAQNGTDNPFFETKRHGDQAFYWSPGIGQQEKIVQPAKKRPEIDNEKKGGSLVEENLSSKMKKLPKKNVTNSSQGHQNDQDEDVHRNKMKRRNRKPRSPFENLKTASHSRVCFGPFFVFSVHFELFYMLICFLPEHT